MEKKYMEDELSLVYENSIFSGYTDDDKEEKDDSEKEEKDSSEESSEESEKTEKSDEKEEKDDSDDSDDKEDDKDEKKSEGEGERTVNKSIQSKVKSLQKQYNDILIAAFEMHAADCVDQALEETDGAFGENIQDVISRALDMLKGKVLTELGIESVEAGGEIGEDELGDLDMGFGDEEAGQETGEPQELETQTETEPQESEEKEESEEPKEEESEEKEDEKESD